MKITKHILSIIVAMSCISVIAQTNDQNFIHTTDYKVATTNGQTDLNGQQVGIHEKIQSISYVNGLGYNVQSISAQAGGQGNDLVSYSELNEFGFSDKSYLPLPSANISDLDFTSPTALKSDIANYYATRYGANHISYGETKVENSPELRPVKVGAPGEDWKVLSGDDHTQKFEYELNDVLDNVLNFGVDFIGTDPTEPTLTLTGIFSNGVLNKRIIRDENWTSTTSLTAHSSEEYINSLGQTLLKRTYDGSQVHDTYYIYDDFGNLSFALSPRASQQITDVNGNLKTSHPQIIADLGYEYRYDHRNRLIWKQIPGKEYEVIVYDTLDRPILTQDGYLRVEGKYLFTKYDAFNRVAYTGFYASGKSREQVNTEYLTSNLLSYEQRVSSPASVASGGTVFFYSKNLAYPVGGLEILSINYYDSYVDMASLVIPTTVYAQLVSTSLRGLPTVSKTRVLDLNAHIWITSANFYDDKNRVIQSSSYNAFHDATDITINDLNFIGNVVKSTTTHEKGANPIITTRDYFTYDHVNRLLSHEQKIDDSPIQLIAENSYDELGQLMIKDVGGETFLNGYTDVTNLNIEANSTITKEISTLAWDAGLKTRGEVLTDGGISYKFPDDTAVDISGEFRIGLIKAITTGPSGGWDDVDFGIEHKVFLGPFGAPPVYEVRIIENGTVQQTPVFNYAHGEVFTIERVLSGNTATYEFRIDGNAPFASVTDTSTSFKVGLVGQLGVYNDHTTIEDVHLIGPNSDKVLQNINYDYNIRGWLTDIGFVDEILDDRSSSGLFRFRITYNNPEMTSISTPLYNGNISETIWKSKTENNLTKRAYSYNYDDLNRITGGVSRKGETLNLSDVHSISSVSYDTNGNILGLVRNGSNNDNTASGGWDDLTYSYEGNQLINVTDLQTIALPSYGFNDGNIGSGSTPDYEYNYNGNLTRDRNKGITSIDYNHLNLPTEIEFNNNSTTKISYIYDASGMKQSKIMVDGANTHTTAYAGNYVYLDDALEFFNHPEGYIEPVANTVDSKKGYDGGSGQVFYSAYRYIFQYKDHLGNVRLSYSDTDLNGVINPSTEIIEESNYYPFGLKQKGYNNVVSSNGNALAQQWKFGGKEYNEELGLDWYDVTARNYDPALGRWMNIDPLADQMRRHSPYNFAFDNPIYWTDPDGMAPCPPGVDCDNQNSAIPIGDGTGNHGSVAGNNQSSGKDNSKYFDGSVVFQIGGVDFGPTTKIKALAGPAEFAIPTAKFGKLAKLFFGNSKTGTKATTVVDDVVSSADNVADDVASSVDNAVDSGNKIHGNSVDSPNPSGSYELKFESGKTYNGVGPKTRMEASAKNLSKKNYDPVVSKGYTNTANRKEAYINEHNGIQKNGGAGNTNRNYNKNNSPGKKLVNEKNGGGS